MKYEISDTAFLSFNVMLNLGTPFLKQIKNRLIILHVENTYNLVSKIYFRWTLALSLNYKFHLIS